MLIFAIETNGKTVAPINEDNRPKLDGFLNGDLEDGQVLRRDILSQYWDGKSPFTAQLVTPLEELDYHYMNEGISESDSESIWWFDYDYVSDLLKAERSKAA